jgi:hypothetical protein
MKKEASLANNVLGNSTMFLVRARVRFVQLPRVPLRFTLG